ncbi:S53 family peptidase [Spelaeicoccus albus]|uniref:Subtilase family serine protease n=1 Tax=Spelaeicoccus albus TaxID=1280376 RepID=A0A7Z0D1D8_9MICO|nr:S53 family peptidase [Spelaeicoccus albus]NYI65920.1 subtilase family serine protease [Spelaeicoccus albus]
MKLTDRRLRTLTKAVVAPAMVLGMCVAGPVAAEAAPLMTHAVHAAAPADHSNDQHTLQLQKSADAETTPAACNHVIKSVGRTPVAHCMAMLYTPQGHIQPSASAPPSTAITPNQLRDAYNLPDGGEGVTVAIVDAGGYSSAQSDLNAYRSHYGISSCTTANGCFSKYDQNGGTDYPADDPGWSVETALDLDAVSAVCPKCDIMLVQGDDASFDSLGKAVDTAVAKGADYVSNSYGVDNEGTSSLQDYDHYYNHKGVGIIAASGDTGNTQSWPATNPTVTGVGGTKLTKNSSSRGWAETAWVSGGSGCSNYEPKPAFQEGLTTNCTNRASADVAADADPSSGLAVYNTLGQDGWGQVGGTSLASPLMAGMFALAGAPAAGTYPVTYPYANSSQLFDITNGSNGTCGNLLCNAGSGYDGPTGMGTPNGVGALHS